MRRPTIRASRRSITFAENPYIKRRDFLKGALLTSLYALLSGCDEVEQAAQPTAKNGSSAEIIVIGAGMAGLSAARKLQQEDYEVILLEGRNRIGGRIWTNRSWSQIPLDMGASWIHGVRKNPVAELAAAFDIQTVPTDYDSFTLYDSAGQEVNEAEQVAIEQLLEEVLEALDEMRQKVEGDRSLQAAVDEVLVGYDLSPQELQRLNYAFNTIIEHDYAADIAQLSLFEWDQGEGFGGQDVLFPGGYDQITRRLAAGLDIRLEHLVSQIAYDGDGARVTTDRGVFQADQAVVTLPLGVLKNGLIEFTPGLSARKQQAIQNLGMGVLNKLYLRFPDVFWEKDSQVLGYISPNKGEWAEWYNIYNYTGKPVLFGFNAGSYGRQIEAMPEEAVVAAAMRVLRTIYDQATLEPEAWLISRWGSDPFAGGSYSYLPPGASGDDYDALAAPVNERLFFAGEATSRDYSATVHGAWLSGQRAAAQIMEL